MAVSFVIISEGRKINCQWHCPWWPPDKFDQVKATTSLPSYQGLIFKGSKVASVTRSNNFWNVLVTNFRPNAAQILGQFWRLLKWWFSVKNFCIDIWATLGHIELHFDSNIRSLALFKCVYFRILNHTENFFQFCALNIRYNFGRKTISEILSTK